MRRLNKYKSFNKVKFFLRCPSRVLNFKKAKWVGLKEFLKRKLDLSRVGRYKNKLTRRVLPTSSISNLIDPMVIKQDKNRVGRVNRFYAETVRSRLTYSVLNDRMLNMKKLQGKLRLNKNRLDLYKSLLAENLFNVTSLLWVLSFCRTQYQAKQELQAKKILVNSKAYVKNMHLTVGDSVSYMNNSFDLGFNLKRYQMSNSQILSFAEVDVYSQELVVVKDKESLVAEDLSLLYKDPINVVSLRG